MTGKKRSGLGKTPSEEIDDIITETPDWRGETLSQLRALIRRADPSIIEEVKWKKPSQPEGVPVWSHDGIVCVGNVLKKAVRLTFPKGAQIKDSRKVFNTRLDSKTVRAVDVFEGDRADEVGLKKILLDAVKLNVSGKGES